MSLNPIERRIYVRGRLHLDSPLVIGSGEDENTNIDLIRDGDGEPFIPGTSLAGCLRHHLEEILPGEVLPGGKERANPIVYAVFGEKEKESKLSLLTVFDAIPLPLSLSADGSAYTVSTRDGLELDYITKTVTEHTASDEDRDARGGAKYDYEIIEPGAAFDLKLELVTRKMNHDQLDGIYDALALLLTALENGNIRLGAKSRRGFGKLRLTDTKILELDMEQKKDVGKWINFDWDFLSHTTLAELGKNVLSLKAPSHTTISVDFSIPYSLLIRHYNDDPSDDDAAQLMSRGKPVIPGTSWNGALLHAVHDILGQLVEDEEIFEKTFTKIKHDLFGFVAPGKEDSKSQASRIIIDESIIRDGTPISYTRNKVDRFTGGVVDSALFSEKAIYGGSVGLIVTVKESKGWDIGLLLLALKDMANGIQPVGGDSNIGRGVLKAENKNISVNGQPLPKEDDNPYFKEFYVYINSITGGTNG